jgi:hypothetical protein
MLAVESGSFALSELVSLLLWPQSTDLSGGGMPEARFKAAKLPTRPGIAGFCGSP